MSSQAGTCAWSRSRGACYLALWWVKVTQLGTCLIPPSFHVLGFCNTELPPLQALVAGQVREGGGASRTSGQSPCLAQAGISGDFPKPGPCSLRGPRKGSDSNTSSSSPRFFSLQHFSEPHTLRAGSHDSHGPLSPTICHHLPLHHSSPGHPTPGPSVGPLLLSPSLGP